MMTITLEAQRTTLFGFKVVDQATSMGQGPEAHLRLPRTLEKTPVSTLVWMGLPLSRKMKAHKAGLLVQALLLPINLSMAATLNPNEGALKWS